MSLVTPPNSNGWTIPLRNNRDASNSRVSLKFTESLSKVKRRPY